MSVEPLDFKLVKFLENPFNCYCGEDNFVMGFVHDKGEEHPQCEGCVRRWTLEQKDPTCAICRIPINPKSILNEREIKEAAKKRKKEQIEREEERYREDRSVAESLARGDAGFFDRTFAPLTGGDAALARRLQSRANKEQNPLCNPCVWVSAAVMAVAGIVLIEAFKS